MQCNWFLMLLNEINNLIFPFHRSLIMKQIINSSINEDVFSDRFCCVRTFLSFVKSLIKNLKFACSKPHGSHMYIYIYSHANGQGDVLTSKWTRLSFRMNYFQWVIEKCRRLFSLKILSIPFFIFLDIILFF